METPAEVDVAGALSWRDNAFGSDRRRPISIVAISDALGSLAEEIGHELARTLAYRFADRQIIMSVAAERFGGSLREFAHATEEKPALWDRFGGAEQRFLSAVQAVIFEMANAGDTVLLGWLPTMLLAGIGHAIRVRIVASEAMRAVRLQSQQGLTRSGALEVIRKADRERAARSTFLHHVDGEDLRLYDLTINTDRMGVDTATRLLREVAADARFQPTTDSRKELSDRSIAAHAEAALSADPRMRGARLDVTCQGGWLLLVGRVDREAQREAAQEIVQKIPAVTHVLNEVGGTPSGRYRAAPWRSARR